MIVVGFVVIVMFVRMKNFAELLMVRTLSRLY